MAITLPPVLDQGEEQRAVAAHILRRTGFGPFPGAVEAALDAHGSPDAILEAAIAAEPIPFPVIEGIDGPLDLENEALGNNALQKGWVRRMIDDDAGLHEKMMWFWHTHFTTSLTKAPGPYCWRQLRLLHQEALGNFGDLAKAMSVDAAMLQFLDGANSQVQDPNENYSRELLELFTMGRGNYTEDDVRAGARAMAGWRVVPDEAGPVRDPMSSLREPVTYLGATKVFTPDLAVDQILAQDATAPFIVAKLARYLIAVDPSPAQVAEWAQLFRSSGYEIRPLVEAMLRSDLFASARLSRSRHGIEWMCVVLRTTGIDVPDSHYTEAFSQVPYAPPNVAGWPDRWLTTSMFYARAAFLYGMDSYGFDLAKEPIGDVTDPVPDLLAHCGLYDVSTSTTQALQAVVDEAPDDQQRWIRSALLTPEFALA